MVFLFAHLYQHLIKILVRPVSIVNGLVRPPEMIPVGWTVWGQVKVYSVGCQPTPPSANQVAVKGGGGGA